MSFHFINVLTYNIIYYINKYIYGGRETIKKGICSILSILICGIMLFGCGGDTPKGVNVDASTGDKIVINFDNNDYTLKLEAGTTITSINKGDEAVGMIMLSDKSLFEVSKSVTLSMDSSELLEEDSDYFISSYSNKNDDGSVTEYISYQTKIADSSTAAEVIVYLDEAQAKEIFNKLSFSLAE